MSNPLQQTIEALAKEKGIEPETVISAIEEAVATASRKYYKTGENLKTRFNTETGHGDLAARSARDVPSTLRGRGREQHRARRRDGVSEADRSAGADRGADRQAGDFPESPRGRARKHFRGVQPAHRRGRQRHDQALRERRHHSRDRAHRGGAPPQGTVARRKLYPRRSGAHGHQRRQPEREGA